MGREIPSPRMRRAPAGARPTRSASQAVGPHSVGNGDRWVRYAPPMDREKIERARATWKRDQERRALIRERTQLLTALDGMEREQFRRALAARRERAEADALDALTPANIWKRLTGAMGALEEKERAESDAALAHAMELGARIGEHDRRVTEIGRLLYAHEDTWQRAEEAIGALDESDVPGAEDALAGAREVAALEEARYRLVVATRAIGAWAHALLCGVTFIDDPEIRAIARTADAKHEAVRDALSAVDEAFEHIGVEVVRGAYADRLELLDGRQHGGRADVGRVLELLPILSRDLAAWKPDLAARADAAATRADLDRILARAL